MCHLKLGHGNQNSVVSEQEGDASGADCYRLVERPGRIGSWGGNQEPDLADLTQIWRGIRIRHVTRFSSDLFSPHLWVCNELNCLESNLKKVGNT